MNIDTAEHAYRLALLQNRNRTKAHRDFVKAMAEQLKEECNRIADEKERRKDLGLVA